MFITLISGLMAGPAVSFSGIADRVAGDGRLVLFAPLAGVPLEVDRFVFDHLLGVVPGAAGIGHEDGQQLAGDDHASQEAGQTDRSQ